MSPDGPKKTPSIRRGRAWLLFLSFRNLVLSELAPSLEGGLPWLQRASPSATQDKNVIQLSEKIIVGPNQMSRSAPAFLAGRLHSQGAFSGLFRAPSPFGKQMINPGFPFWPSWQRKSMAAMQRFRTTATFGTPFAAAPAFGSARSYRSCDHKGLFGNTAPAPPLGNPCPPAVPGRRRYPPGTSNAESRPSISPNSLRFRYPSAKNSPIPPRIILHCPIEAYLNWTPPEPAILLSVRFFPFREVTPFRDLATAWGTRRPGAVPGVGVVDGVRLMRRGLCG